jgi:hypothetical protein
MKISLREGWERYFPPVQNEARHHLDGLAQRVRRVAGTLHELQKLYDALLDVWTLHVQLVGETLAGGRNIGEAEFPPLIEFAFNCYLRFLDLDPQV